MIVPRFSHVSYNHMVPGGSGQVTQVTGWPLQLLPLDKKKYVTQYLIYREPKSLKTLYNWKTCSWRSFQGHHQLLHRFLAVFIFLLRRQEGQVRRTAREDTRPESVFPHCLLWILVTVVSWTVLPRRKYLNSHLLVCTWLYYKACKIFIVEGWLINVDCGFCLNWWFRLKMRKGKDNWI